MPAHSLKGFFFRANYVDDLPARVKPVGLELWQRLSDARTQNQNRQRRNRNQGGSDPLHEVLLSGLITNAAA